MHARARHVPVDRSRWRRYICEGDPGREESLLVIIPVRTSVTPSGENTIGGGAGAGAGSGAGAGAGSGAATVG
jgi:hypothetical protein